jgi:hypothetical protein
MARPTKLTKEMQEKICDLIRRGNYLSTASKQAGVDRNTVRKWLDRGKASKKGMYFEFRCAVDAAIAYAEVNDVEMIRKAAAIDWRAAAWRLKHRYPQRWGKTRHEVTGKDGGPVSVENKRSVDDYTEAELLAILNEGQTDKKRSE